MSSRITLITSFSHEGFQKYGREMLTSACRYVPENVEILAYYNEVKPEFHNDRVTFIDNYSIDGGVREFIKRHGKDQRLWGKIPGQEENFRIAANRFAHKMESLFHADSLSTADYLLYADADIVIFSDVPESFFDEILPLPHYAAVLDRGPAYHFETGWLQLRRSHPYHKEFLQRYINFMRKDTFLKEREFHDAWLTTQLMKQMRDEGKITWANLSPGHIGSGHPWTMSRLAEFSDHKKGRRKEVGSSWQEDLIGTRTEEYWQNLPRRKQ